MKPGQPKFFYPTVLAYSIRKVLRPFEPAYALMQVRLGDGRQIVQSVELRNK